MENINSKTNQSTFIYSKSLFDLNISLKKLDKNRFVTNIQNDNFNKLIPPILKSFYYNKSILKFNKFKLSFYDYDFLLMIFRKSNPHINITDLLQTDKILESSNKNFYLIYDNNKHKIELLNNLKDNKLNIIDIKETFNMINSLIYIKYNLINKDKYKITYILGTDIKYLPKIYISKYFPHFYFSDYDKSLHIVSDIKDSYLKIDITECDMFDNIIIPKMNESIKNLLNYFKKYVI